VQILTYNQNITDAEEIILIENTDYFIRKLAHFSIYSIGGILIYNYINTYDINVKRKIIISLLIGVIYAIFDEFHQYFVADRSAQIFDVCIDSSGAIIGVIFIYLINKIKKPLSN
jgi:VanZ family protein